MGTMGSRSLQVGGTAVQHATDEVLEKGRRLAAHLLEADAGDIEVVPGQGLGVAGSPASRDPVGRAGQGRGRPVAAAGGLRGRPGRRERLRDAGRDVPVRHAPRGRRGRHRDRAGEARAPHHGRRRGPDHEPDAGRGPGPRRHRPGRRAGAVRGDRVRRGRQQRHRLAGVATRSRAPATCRRSRPSAPQTPTPRNPLGAKGIGEAGAIGSTPAVWNAVVDALSHLGVRNIDMPATPQRVWQAISAAR